ALNDILKNNPVFALGPDLNARGIAEITAGVKSIGYEGFVELVEDHQVNSWL
ncbi:MAG: DsrH/TusB family sulfur metabolism protein, partial [SAR324 cluster bacterium]|nr:DsrH/TusB family sulfur metabolism protein [SAR324 cluster bacterium]